MNIQSTILSELNDSTEIFKFNGISIIVESNLLNDAEKIRYFKVLSGRRNRDGIYNFMCRISMNRPEYLGLEGETLILSDNMIDDIIAKFNKKSEYDSHLSNWQYMIEIINEYNEGEDKLRIPTDLPMPDYTKLKRGYARDYKNIKIYHENDIDKLVLSTQKEYDHDIFIMDGLLVMAPDNIGERYIKVLYDCDENGLYAKMCCLSIDEPKYIISAGTTEDLSSELIDKFMHIIKYRYPCSEESYTYWNHILGELNCKSYPYLYDENIPVPDYTKLKK